MQERLSVYDEKVLRRLIQLETARRQERKEGPLAYIKRDTEAGAAMRRLDQMGMIGAMYKDGNPYVVEVWAVVDGELVLALDDPKTQIRIFNEIITQGYSVRKVEEMVKSLSAGEDIESGGKTISPKGTRLSEEYTILQNHLCNFFGTKVQLSCNPKGKGKISIPFNNETDLERIMEILDSLKKTE